MAKIESRNLDFRHHTMIHHYKSKLIHININGDYPILVFFPMDNYARELIGPGTNARSNILAEGLLHWLSSTLIVFTNYYPRIISFFE